MPSIDLMYIIRTVVFPAIAAGAAAWVFWYLIRDVLASAKSAPEKALDEYFRQKEKKDTSEVKMGSPEYKLRLAFSSVGLDVSGWEKVALYIAYVIAAVVVIIPTVTFGMPFALIIGLPFIGIVSVNAYVDSRWDEVKGNIEKEIPVMLNRLSSLLKANPNLIETMENISEGLDPDKPLKAWILRFANKLQSSGRKGLTDMQEEASLISPSLLLAVVEIGRLWETGGSGYSEALRMTAGNMADLMETRSQAMAVATGAWGTTRTILLALGFTLTMVMVNPASKPFFSTPLMQLALLGVMIWGGMGYWNIRDDINEVVE